MGERAKIILNEYSAKNLLMRDTLDLDKFYTTDLKLFIEVARKEIERLGNELQVQIEDNSRLNEYIKEQDQQLQQKENIIKEVREYINWRLEEHQDMYKYQMEELLEILEKEVN